MRLLRVEISRHPSVKAVFNDPLFKADRRTYKPMSDRFPGRGGLPWNRTKVICVCGFREWMREETDGLSM